MEILKSTIKPILPLPTKFIDVFAVKYAPHGRILINSNQTNVLLVCYFYSHENTIIDQNNIGYTYDSAKNEINLTFYTSEKDQNPGKDILVHAILNYDLSSDFYTNTVLNKAKLILNIENKVISFSGTTVKAAVKRSGGISTDPIPSYPPLDA